MILGTPVIVLRLLLKLKGGSRLVSLSQEQKEEMELWNETCLRSLPLHLYLDQVEKLMQIKLVFKLFINRNKLLTDRWYVYSSQNFKFNKENRGSYKMLKLRKS